MARVNMTLCPPDEWWMDYDVDEEIPEQHEFMLWVSLYNKTSDSYEKEDENGDDFTIFRQGATAEDAVASVEAGDIDDVINELAFVNGYDEDWFRKNYTSYEVYDCRQIG